MARIGATGDFSAPDLETLLPDERDPENRNIGDSISDRGCVVSVGTANDGAAVLCAAFDPPDNRIQTSAVIVFQVFLMVDMLALVYGTPFFPDLPVPIFSLIVYMHCGAWFISYIIDAYLGRQHTLLSCHGFIEFYQKVKHLRRVALNTLGFGTILMLLVSVFVSDYCVDRLSCPRTIASYVYLQAIVTVEAFMIIPVLVYYLKLNHDFHRDKTPPDIESPDFIASILQAEGFSEIGYRDNRPIEDIVEKQSDMIRYLKTYNTYLKRKVLRLHEDLQSAQARNFLNV